MATPKRFIHGRRARLADPRLVRITHDLVVNVLTGSFPFPAGFDLAQERERLENYVEVLCWVLGHTDSDQPGSLFERHMHKLAGLVLTSAGWMPGPEPEPAEEEPERVN